MPHSEDVATQLLDPYLDMFGRIFPTAWESWERFGEMTPDLRLQVCPRTRATMLNNFAAHAAEEIFEGMGPEIVLTDQPGFLLIIVDSKLHVRLKKYRSRKGQTSGIPTDQRELFESQQPLIGFPDASNCVHGYILKRDVSGFAETMITCKTKKVMHWSIDVPMIEAGANVTELPTTPSSGEAAEPGISSTMLEEDAEETDQDAEDGGIGG
ncbi:MAG TPA: hypothetical protein VH299_04455 [Solirubrobacterales bacterium]|jgi:hypothetical protein|nr:hypothetical protein [Solirubrobacterales bacterium]